MSDPTEIIKRAYDAFRGRDLKALEEISDPEIEISSVTGILSGRETPYVGIAALVSYIRDVSTIWDSIELVPEGTGADDQGVGQGHPEIGRPEVHHSSFPSPGEGDGSSAFGSTTGTVTPASC